MNRWVRTIERIDRKYIIQIPITMILILTTVIFPSAQLVTAAGGDDILNVSDLSITNDSKNSIDKGGCWRFYNDNAGFYIPSSGKWYLKHNKADGWDNVWNINFSGPSGSVAVSGDWNNDNEDSIGFYVPSQGKWYFKNNKDSGWSSFLSLNFAGPSGAIPVAGDWNGNGYDTVGFYVPSQGKWYLKNDLVNGWSNYVGFNFTGPSGSQPVAGDWDVDGIDTVGFYVPSQGKWYLKNNQISGWNSYLSIKWAGVSGALAVAGDWDEDGFDTIGFYVPSQGKWYLKNSYGPGWDSGVTSFKFSGPSGSLPIAGDWDGNTCVTVGIQTNIVGIPTGTTGSAIASCPTGSIVTSGGFATHKDLPVYTQNKSGNGWIAYAKNTGGTTLMLVVFAQCLYNVPAITEQVVDQDSTPSSGYYSPQAECPSGSTVTGGGWASSSSGGLDIYHSDKATNGWDVWAYDDAGGPELLNADAICLSGVNATTTQIQEIISIPAGSAATASPACSSGLVTGGGFSGTVSTTIVSNYPDPANFEWDAQGDNPTGGSVSFVGYTECITFP